MRLFSRGDCQETCRERRTKLPHERWIKCLLTRQDFPLFRMDGEFVASAYNVFLRRDQMSAVEAYAQNMSGSGTLERLQELTATGLVQQVMASGDVNSVRAGLRKKNLEAPAEETLRQMQITRRKVRGSEEERDTLIFKFRALRIRFGCSSLFFTLNPPDI